MWMLSVLRLSASKYRCFLLPVTRGVKTNRPIPPNQNDFEFDPIDFLKRFMRGCLEIAGVKKVSPADREKLKMKRYAVTVMGLVAFTAYWEVSISSGHWK